MRLPRIVDEGEHLFLRCFVDGVDRQCEVSKGQAEAMVLVLLAWIFKASRR